MSKSFFFQMNSLNSGMKISNEETGSGTDLPLALTYFQMTQFHYFQNDESNFLKTGLYPFKKMDGRSIFIFKLLGN